MNKSLLLQALVILENLAIIAGTAYIVFWRDESGWWFLLAIALVSSIKKDEKPS